MWHMNKCFKSVSVFMQRWRLWRQYLVLNEGVDSLQHPLTGELIGQVGLNLITQTYNRSKKKCQERTLCMSLFHCMSSFESCPQSETSSREDQQLKLCCALSDCVWREKDESEEERGGKEPEPSWSLVGCSSPRITKHMRLWGLSAEQSHCSESLGGAQQTRGPEPGC